MFATKISLANHGLLKTSLGRRCTTALLDHRRRSTAATANQEIHSVVHKFGTVRFQSTTSTTTTTPTSRAASSSTTLSCSATATEEQPEFHPMYVHHVSRVSLEHLQENRSDWLIAYGLDRTLQIRKNGTFVLNFPDGGQICTSYDPHRRRHWLSVYRNELAVRFLLRDHVHAAVTLQQEQERQGPQPQSSVYRVQNHHASSVQKIQRAVDAMIRAVEAAESKDRR